MPESCPDICKRIAAVRVELFGHRGKAAFAKKLGLSASTYDYYESTRVPPADILVRIADAAAVDLRWLLTGQAGPAGPQVAADHPILRRAAELLSRSPDAAAALGAFLDLLTKSLEFPPKDAVASGQPPTGTAPAMPTPIIPHPEPSARNNSASKSSLPSSCDQESNVGDGLGGDAAGWIPILGRSAAGVPQFWTSSQEAAQLTSLRELIARHELRAMQSRPAAIAGEADLVQDMAQIITTRQGDDQGVCEFIAAPAVLQQYRDAFAVRFDGQSMAPDISHGDLVILSPSQPAIDGRPAVIQLQQQIGVTCKLWRKAGEMVHLVPINETIPTTAVPAENVVWALRVLARIRP